MPRPPTSDPSASLVPPRVGRVPWKTFAALVILALASFNLDELGSMAFQVVDLPGDVDQELRSLQQFGQFGSLVLLTIVVLRLERPALRRTLLDLGLALLLGALVCNGLKTLVGRARPAFGTPDEFHPLWSSVETTMSWSQLASMPSSHTMAAAVTATWIAVVVPRLRWLGFGLVVVVGVARIRFGHHWPSDVFAGAAIGSLIGSVTIGRLLGTRLLDVLWRALVDRNASPAAPTVAIAVRNRRNMKATT